MPNIIGGPVFFDQRQSSNNYSSALPNANNLPSLVQDANAVIPSNMPSQFNAATSLSHMHSVAQ